MRSNTNIAFALLLSIGLILGCSSTSSGLPDASGTNDAQADASAESSTDAGTDVIPADSPVDQDASADVGLDGSVWPGPPWYGCTSNDIPSGTTVVTAFNKADQYYDQVDGSTDDRRTIETSVDFPAQGNWDQIDMRVQLDCPADGQCDHWDRLAGITLIDDAVDAAPIDILELQRYITPFDTGMCFMADVTEFAPRLNGSKRVQSFIDTWVGPHFQASNGHGWRVTVQFIFHPGTPSALPNQIVNVWPATAVIIGDSSNTIASQLPNQNIAIPPGTTKAELRMIVTGHGQGNLDNCGEFCELTQAIKVNSTVFQYDPWRDDCADNPLGSKQMGTWTYARNGWCPGAYVVPKVIDVTAAVTAGQTAAFSYDVVDAYSHEYDNSCRPDAGDETNTCVGCAADNTPGNCDYNGGAHTEPQVSVTTELVLYN